MYIYAFFCEKKRILHKKYHANYCFFQNSVIEYILYKDKRTRKPRARRINLNKGQTRGNPATQSYRAFSRSEKRQPAAN